MQCVQRERETQNFPTECCRELGSSLTGHVHFQNREEANFPEEVFPLHRQEGV